MIRTVLFWLHLACGLVAGIVILMMSVTGVILTYERQMQVWEDRSYYAEPELGQQQLSADQLIEASSSIVGFEPSSLMLSSDPTAPAVLRQGNSQTHILNPYTGRVYAPHSDSLSRFFAAMHDWHRWLNINGDGRNTARDITGAANIMFLFLLVSGIYLWLPRSFSRATLRVRTLFNSEHRNGQARDFNWHHVYGFWAALPLLIVIFTAISFHFNWAINPIYQLAGEERPVILPPNNETLEPAQTNRVPYESLFALAKTYSEDWRTITLTISASGSNAARLVIDEGDGGQPQKRYTLTVEATNGDVITWKPFTNETTGTQARLWMRYLHTGEALGIVGQTIAGLASFAGIIMVWTGFALALRRLQRWLTRKKKMGIRNFRAEEVRGANNSE